MSYKSLFIGGALLESQLVYIIPFAHGYSITNKVSTWIIESELPTEILKNERLAVLLKRYNIIVLKRKNSAFRGITKWLFAIISLPFAFFYAYTSTRKNLLNAKSWFNSQIYHSIWDTALLAVKDGTLEPDRLSLFSAAISCFSAGFRIIIQRYRYNCTDAILGHNVYKFRSIEAFLRKMNVNVITQGSNALIAQPKYFDRTKLILSKSEWKFLDKAISSLNVSDFWDKRASGQGSYEPATLAARSTRMADNCTPTNVIFLHVFKDSPFHYIDRSRIYADYIEWIRETIRIIQMSDENWLIKTHPLAKRWGEDQEIWLAKLLGKENLKVLPNNIFVDSRSEYSNLSLFTHAKRVITFHGTCHIEAACWGLKPITIRENLLSSYSQDLVHLPRSCEDYRELLLTDSNSDIFSLNEADVYTCRRIMYIRDELLSYGKDINDKMVCKGDQRDVLDLQFDSVLKALPRFFDHFVELGLNFSSQEGRSYAFMR